jgi:rubrerythrin
MSSDAGEAEGLDAVPGERGAVPEGREAVVAEMLRALRAELGARALYGWLARLARDRELRRLMGGLEEEEDRQVDDLCRLLASLGERPRRWSLRRRTASFLLAWSTPVFGTRPVLRLCEEAEGTASRWYACFAEHFVRSAAPEEARRCNAMALLKARHASALQAFVNHAHRR